MNTSEFICSVIDFLNEHNVPYMLVGSLATNFYCVPRSTEDGDIVVETSLAELGFRIRRALAGVQFDPQLSFESVTGTRKIVLQTTEHNFQIELFGLSDDEHDRARFARRIQVQMLGRDAWIASLEDMIITKLRWSQYAGREKDISDVRNLISVQQEMIDWPYVESWADRHGTREILERLRRECAEA